jgi:hypothetical protein
MQEHSQQSGRAPYFRFLSCVSGALWSERGDTRTLFSAENIIETFFALVGRNGDSAIGIQHTCDLLNLYRVRLEQAREDQSILQNPGGPPGPESVWHDILIESMKKQSPTQDAEAGVRRDQARYCLFAAQCRTAQNSPFAVAPPPRPAAVRSSARPPTAPPSRPPAMAALQSALRSPAPPPPLSPSP